MSRPAPGTLALCASLAAVAAGAAPVRPAPVDRAPPALDVPYLAQTEALCGGAAVAMVLRYYGEPHAAARQFADLVDRRAGGIATDLLVERVRALGWRAAVTAGSTGSLRSAIAAGHPPIVLVETRPGQYHYLVVVGLDGTEVTVHDPEWGPYRSVPLGRFDRAWQAARFWTAVIEPGGAAGHGPTPPAAAGLRPRELSDPSAGPAGDLAARAGQRFAGHRWAEAEALASRAVAADPHDGYAWDVLGSARFIEDDLTGALDAWNHLGRPRVDRVTIEGLTHTRFAAIAGALGLRSGALLTSERLRLARRRLEQLPDRSASRVEYRPAADGYATVHVAMVQRRSLPHGPFQWGAEAARAAVTREAAVALPGTEGAGELWSASWRWWEGRPRVAFSFAAPQTAVLPGIWRVDASWEAQTYVRPGGGPVRETRTHGALVMSNWLTPTLRYEITGGLDAWNAGRRAPFAGARIERRWLRDRLALSGGATAWLAIGDRAFQTADALGTFASSRALSGFRWIAAGGVQAATAAAPLGLWAGAGTGPGRGPLLRAHTLVNHGAIAGPMFGRRLAYGTLEVQRWTTASRPVRFGVAGFADAARAAQGFGGAASPLQVDVGAGLRLAVPAVGGAMRIDVAHGLHDGATALTVGWMPR